MSWFNIIKGTKWSIITSDHKGEGLDQDIPENMVEMILGSKNLKDMTAKDIAEFLAAAFTGAGGAHEGILTDHTNNTSYNIEYGKIVGINIDVPPEEDENNE